ncbi:MAG TPA: DUF2905 domain-containing protein [Moorella mulderi]|nr:DUF2905 domain-containing protein [Moorella mulderi]
MLGKMLIGIGALLVIMGGLLYLLEKNLPLGRLPGDIYIQKGAFTFYFPLVTCILLSLLLTILLNLILRH